MRTYLLYRAMTVTSICGEKNPAEPGGPRCNPWDWRYRPPGGPNWKPWACLTVTIALFPWTMQGGGSSDLHHVRFREMFWQGGYHPGIQECCLLCLPCSGKKTNCCAPWKVYADFKIYHGCCKCTLNFGKFSPISPISRIAPVAFSIY